jgi:hypothetical protein
MEPWRWLEVESPICILHFPLILMNDDTEGREAFSSHHLRLWQWNRSMKMDMVHLNQGSMENNKSCFQMYFSPFLLFKGQIRR